MSPGEDVLLGIACAAAVATLFSASPIRAQTAQGEPIRIGAVASLIGSHDAVCLQSTRALGVPEPHGLAMGMTRME